MVLDIKASASDVAISVAAATANISCALKFVMVQPKTARALGGLANREIMMLGRRGHNGPGWLDGSAGV